jgi:3-deoxy-manno-octulosonate cytidylyltransferase (CMP-KDO synthetase)
MNYGSYELPFRVAIPARYASTRLPGKPLRLIAGRTLLEHVYMCALASGALEVVIATDDARIMEAAEGFGATVCMTSSEHLSGTDRISELTMLYGWPDEAIVVNLQVDELQMSPVLIRQAAAILEENTSAGIVTFCTRVRHLAELFDPNVVKVTLDHKGFASYFSRAPIPWHRTAFSEAAFSELESLRVYSGAVTEELLKGNVWFRHIGLYAYRTKILQDFTRLEPVPIELAECLEQLRAIWYGIRIYVSEVVEAPPPGIDTESDLIRAIAELGDKSQILELHN